MPDDKRKLKHVWEVIQELDAWMRHAIDVSVTMDFVVEKEIKAFEKARNSVAEAFPRALDSYHERLAQTEGRETKEG